MMLIIHAMFLASGAAALIYQVIWVKQLQFVLGSSTFAVSVTVASFFSGLSLGSWLGGRLADRLLRPLRAYAVLEFSVGAVSLAVTLFLSKWSVWTPLLTPFLGERSLLSGVLTLLVSLTALALPTMLMGATLPLLAKYIIREQQALARRIGLLYGINTLGAALGCATAGLLLMGTLGVLRSALVSSTIYWAIALIACTLILRAHSRVHGKRGLKEFLTDTPAEDTGKSTQAVTSGPPIGSSREIRALVVVFAVSGFVSIAYEVLWFRVLTNFSLHTVYAFSAMLSTYLLGLVSGAFICAKFLAPRKDRLLINFARLQLLIAAAGLLTVALLGRSRNILMFVAPLPARMGIPGRILDPLAGTTEMIFLSLVVFLLPTTLIGIGFPLASELTIHRLSALGHRLGRLYALNTLGGTLGSLTAGFLLLPYLGTQTSLTLIVALNLLLFAATVASQSTLRRDPRLLRLGAEGVVFFAVGLWLLGPRYLAVAQTRFDGARILAFREDVDATFVVLAYDSKEVSVHQQLVVNGGSYANNALPGRRYMAMLGHLPALLHPNPHSALVACIGTGTTIGALTVHPSVRVIKAVDLSHAVFAFAPLFEPLNHRFQSQPQVETIVADARHYLLTRDRRFDVITFEPPPPQEAGIVNLYSLEFYQLAKRRLEQGGIVAQWVPLDLSRQALPRMMIRTIMNVFPHVSLWIPNRMEGVVIGSMEPLRIDLVGWGRRMSAPALRADLEAIGFHSPEDVAATFVAGDGALADLVGDVPNITDDRPRIEYFNLYPAVSMSYGQIAEGREPIDKYLTAPPHDPAALQTAREVVTLIWKEHEASSTHRWEEARLFLQRALTRDQDNRYLAYLRAVQGGHGE
jgi:predicted membrane-bound spermidine synthase